MVSREAGTLGPDKSGRCAQEGRGSVRRGTEAEGHPPEDEQQTGGGAGGTYRCFSRERVRPASEDFSVNGAEPGRLDQGEAVKVFESQSLFFLDLGSLTPVPSLPPVLA